MSLQATNTPSSTVLADVYNLQSNKKLMSVEYIQNPEDVFYSEINIANENVSLFPTTSLQDSDDRISIFCFGSSKCGKSTFSAQYADRYLNEHKHSNILVIKPDPDKAYDKLNKDRFAYLTPLELFGKYNEMISEDPSRNIMDLISTPGGRTLCIIDDVFVEEFDSDLKKFMTNVLNIVLGRARKRSIDVIVTNQLGSDYKLTRTINAQCQLVWTNPRDFSHSTEYTLTKKYNVDPHIIAKIRKDPRPYGRWIIFSKSFPRFILCPNKISLISGEHI